MNILLIDATSSFLDFALRCEADGHTVRVFFSPLDDGSPSSVGKGLLTVVSDWRAHMNWADFIMTSDNVKYLRELDSFRKRGFPLWGATAATALWELDRDIGQGVLASAGICCIPGQSFTSYDRATELVLSTQKRYVSKASGDADKALSYVSKGAADVLFMLDYWKSQGKGKAPFLMQEFVPGIEMAVGGWFGRDGFSQYFLENFEFKKLMNDEIGVNTGEMGTAIKYCTLEQSKLAQELLLPLQGELFRQGYTGFIDVSVIISDDGCPYPLEFTTRPGWPLFQIQQALHPEPVCWMKAALEGEDCFEPYLDIAIGVVITIPDFPYSRLTRKEVSGFPVWGITEKNRYNIHPAEMKLGEAYCEVKGKLVKKPMLVSAGDYVLVVTGTGKSVSAAKEAAYEVVGELEIPNSPMYRTDIGARLEKQLPKLHKLGYATSWSF